MLPEHLSDLVRNWGGEDDKDAAQETADYATDKVDLNPELACMGFVTSDSAHKRVSPSDSVHGETVTP